MTAQEMTCFQDVISGPPQLQKKFLFIRNRLVCVPETVVFKLCTCLLPGFYKSCKNLFFLNCLLLLFSSFGDPVANIPEVLMGIKM